MSHALLVNAYATGNHGDAAIVQGLIDVLREAGATHVSVAPRDWRDAAGAWRSLGADGVVRPLISQHDAPAWARLHRILTLGYVMTRLGWLMILARLGIHADAAARAYRDADVIVSVGGAYLGGPKAGINLVKTANLAFARSAETPDDRRADDDQSPERQGPHAAALGAARGAGLRPRCAKPAVARAHRDRVHGRARSGLSRPGRAGSHLRAAGTRQGSPVLVAALIPPRPRRVGSAGGARGHMRRGRGRRSEAHRPPPPLHPAGHRVGRR